MRRKKAYSKKESVISVGNDSFVFNLGRLWQEIIWNHWNNVTYLYKLIKEVTPPIIKKRYLKEISLLRLAINEKDSENVNRALEKILKW